MGRITKATTEKKMSKAKKPKEAPPLNNKAEALKKSLNKTELGSVSTTTVERDTPLSHSFTSQPTTTAPRQLFPSNSVSSRQRKQMKAYVKHWTGSLGKEDTKSLAMTLYYVLVTLKGMRVKEATTTIGSLIGKSSNTVRRWKSNVTVPS